MGTVALAAAIGYLLGAIPFGLLMGRLTRGIDIRAYGSHRTGATNALRTLGAGPAAIVFALDIGKGVAAVLIARFLLPADSASVTEWAAAAAGFAAIVGHNWSLFIRFTGGRGVSTSTGALGAMAPWALLVMAPVVVLLLGVLIFTVAAPGNFLSPRKLSVVRQQVTFAAILGMAQTLVILTAGIDLSALTVLAGALGIGVGLGLQNIASNFVSGLSILFERPIKVGDRIEAGKITGDVVSISLRATTIVSNDNIAIIVPNTEFVSSTVINWSYTDRDVRFNIPVGVSYSSDPVVVKRLLLEVAADHPGVLKRPPPDVLFQEFGDSALNFVLRVWTQDYTTRPGVLRSELNFAISKKFKEHGIEIPFPQRDLHIRSGALDLKGTTDR